LERQFHELGLEGARVDALLPGDLPAELVARYCSEDSRIKHGIGHLACTMSHYRAWTAFLESEADAALIFEDDAILSSGLPHFLAELGDDLPEGVDLLKIETFGGAVRLSSCQVQSPAGYAISRLFGNHLGACGYILTRRLAQRLLEDPHRLDLMVDEYLFGRRSRVIFHHRVYQLVPALSIQMSVLHPHETPVGTSSSDLHPERLNGAEPVRASHRWQRTGRLLRSAAMDALHFSYDPKGLLGPRRHVPFSS
jgi:GR25 family glycosyltransferase involved in LPS biosynthesis